jgi:hypothetical protein
MAAQSIYGLENDNYLINNEIIVIFTQLENTKYLQLEFLNNYNGKIAKVRLYPIQNEIKYDISKAVKSLFDLPSFDTERNINQIDIIYSKILNNGAPLSNIISKYFIRGGVFSRERNNYLPNGYVINNNNFGGTPYFMNQYGSYADYIITNGIIEEKISDKAITFDYGCKGKMLRFLNQFGGYSYWYFEFYRITSNSKPFDEVVRINLGFNDNYHFSDIGVNLESDIEFRGSVPLQYNELMKHLIASPEVYFFSNETTNKWIRIKQNSNKQYFDSKEKNFKYKFNFKLEQINNPSVSW